MIYSNLMYVLLNQHNSIRVVLGFEIPINPEQCDDTTKEMVLICDFPNTINLSELPRMLEKVLQYNQVDYNNSLLKSNLKATKKILQILHLVSNCQLQSHNA